jgi:hypothetical protein
MGAWWLDRHPRGKSGYHMHALVRPYGISYRTMVPKGVDNLLVAGRCHSAEPAALASSRVTITAMGLGQAAGTAAGMSLDVGAAASAVNIAKLRDRLLADGCIIGARAEAVLERGDALGSAIPASMPR